MCTLSLITRENGYLLAMNRDESLARGKNALPPTVSGMAIYPKEEAGGTWIASNAFGITLALLNWYERSEAPAFKQRSRGELIPELILRPTSVGVHQAIHGSRLQGMLPFRLVAVYEQERAISEWRWDGAALEEKETDWGSQHWFSSGLSDMQARTARGAACERYWQRADAGSIAWLRELHASHEGGAGAFSVCVHREMVGSVSYTEVEVGPDTVHMRYAAGNPCMMNAEPEGLLLSRHASAQWAG